jgi:alkanesulfonate monooxygenase SsuD/methylene tetrahydromethanopterin reductase-like flavin-dependent oxidoreductase (luciferase family)
VLDRRCEKIGRDPGEVERSAQALFLLTDDADRAARFRSDAGRPAVAGTADDVIEAVAAWQAVGLDEVIVPDFTLGKGQKRLDRMDLLINEVAPSFR